MFTYVISHKFEIKILFAELYIIFLPRFGSEVDRFRVAG